MSRFIPVVTLAIGLSTGVLADDPRSMRYVNLNAPGALEKLASSNPKHYGKIVGILDGIGHKSVSEVPSWIRTSFDAGDVSFSSFLLTSYPPLRDLSFRIDDTRYHARVTLAREGAIVYAPTSR
jgi:hypothetical protein